MDKNKKVTTAANNLLPDEQTKITAAATPHEQTNMRPTRVSHVHMIQNFHLVWLDESIDETKDEDCRNNIIKLRQAVNIVSTFTDADECISFVSEIKEAETLMIFSGSFGQTMVPVVHDMAQVHAIYIFSENETPHKQWTTKWCKVKGVFTDITTICETLKQAGRECDQNSVSLSFVAPSNDGVTQNLNELDSSFMYTQILKEIFLTIDFKQEHFVQFITYCREQLVGNTVELKKVDQLEKEYHLRQPIWWYTCQYSLYSMLNGALRTMEVDRIVNMSFFLRDFHQNINQLHLEQHAGHSHPTSLILYRGQGVSSTDFKRIKKTKGGLMSFKNFLSTSLDRAVSFAFAESNQSNPDLLGVLFQITIDPSVSTTPYAKIRDVSNFQGEEEILLSMHSIFRIGHIEQLNDESRLWQVDLTLTNDHDPQLLSLTERIRKETSGLTGWHRLGRLMIRVGQFNKAEELYKVLLDQTTDEGEKAHLYHQLGWTKDNQGEYSEAIKFYEKSIIIKEKILPENHPNLAASYSQIGMTYGKMREYAKALSYFEKDLEISQKTNPVNYISLATSYNNFGRLYDETGEYSKALAYYKKNLDISHKRLPPNHPDLAISYDNIGLVYTRMKEYPKALSSYEKALEIFQKSLPPNHPDLATCYQNIGRVNDEMKEYPKALSYYEKALKIRQSVLRADHPDLANSYGHIGVVSFMMKGYSKALMFHEKALEIQQNTRPVNHHDLANSYGHIGTVYFALGEYSKAMSYVQRAFEIMQNSG